MTQTIETILSHLATINHPYRPEVLLHAAEDIAEITFEGDKLIIHFTFPKITGQPFSTFQRNVLKCLKQDLMIPKIQLNYADVSIPQTTHSRMADLYPNAQFLAILSGKGGVGKSTVTLLLAEALQKSGKKVAIIDADIYGASIPQILQLPKTAPEASGNKLKPFTKNNLELISSSLIIQDDMPVMWKGPMIQKLLQQFLYDVAWSTDIDFFLFDMPPGTGDILFALNDLLPETKAILVTTPQEDAAYVTIKSGVALQELAIEPIGVIENMAYTICDHCGEHSYIFGKDGGVYVSEALGLSLLGSLPLKLPLTVEDFSSILSTLFQQL